jgi:hypothetical protein
LHQITIQSFQSFLTIKKVNKKATLHQITIQSFLSFLTIKEVNNKAKMVFLRLKVLILKGLRSLIHEKFSELTRPRRLKDLEKRMAVDNQNMGEKMDSVVACVNKFGDVVKEMVKLRQDLGSFTCIVENIFGDGGVEWGLCYGYGLGIVFLSANLCTGTFVQVVNFQRIGVETLYRNPFVGDLFCIVIIVIFRPIARWQPYRNNSAYMFLQDGTSLPPFLIYPSKAGDIHDTWVGKVGTGKHDARFVGTETSWTNHEVGRKWLEEVFDRFSKGKARNERDYRLLITDGHSSHVAGSAPVCAPPQAPGEDFGDHAAAPNLIPVQADLVRLRNQIREANEAQPPVQNWIASAWEQGAQRGYTTREKPLTARETAEKRSVWHRRRQRSDGL